MTREKKANGSFLMNETSIKNYCLEMCGKFPGVGLPEKYDGGGGEGGVRKLHTCMVP